MIEFGILGDEENEPSLELTDDLDAPAIARRAAEMDEDAVLDGEILSAPRLFAGTKSISMISVPRPSSKAKTHLQRRVWIPQRHRSAPASQPRARTTTNMPPPARPTRRPNANSNYSPL